MYRDIAERYKKRYIVGEKPPIFPDISISIPGSRDRYMVIGMKLCYPKFVVIVGKFQNNQSGAMIIAAPVPYSKVGEWISVRHKKEGF